MHTAIPKRRLVVLCCGIMLVKTLTGQLKVSELQATTTPSGTAHGTTRGQKAFPINSSASRSSALADVRPHGIKPHSTPYKPRNA